VYPILLGVYGLNMQHAWWTTELLQDFGCEKFKRLVIVGLSLTIVLKYILRDMGLVSAVQTLTRNFQ
jgi:hypothetical protein